MAEIRVEERRKGRGWLWLLLALLVVAVVVYLLYASGTLASMGFAANGAPGSELMARAPRLGEVSHGLA